MGTFGSSSFATLLENNGYTVSSLTNGPITPQKLQGYDILVIMGPYGNYTDAEVNTINEFVNNGGGLFLVGNNWGNVDGGQNFSFNKIARSFGVDFANNEIVTDDQNNIFAPTFVTINNITPNPITTNVTTFYYLQGTYIKNPGSSNVVAYTSANAWGDQGFTTPQNTTSSNGIKDPNERGGPLPVISEMDYGKGKIVFMGAAGSFINSFIYKSDAWKLGLNTMNWLANRAVPTNYQPAGLISYNLLEYPIIEMILLSLILFAGLFFKIRRDKKLGDPRPFKTIKNWKFNTLIIVNVFFVGLAGLLFIPINFFLYNITLYSIYDPNLGYILVITGALFFVFMGVILFNLIARQRLLVKYSYYSIVLILFFASITVILGNLFSFPLMQIFTFGSLILLIPFALNLWINRSYGSNLVIEGKEFDRLNKLSSKSLPFELQPFYTDSAFIGEGGFGRVFKAINKTGELVALKIPKSFDKKSERTFITEVSNWSHLNHPNIVKLIEYKILPIPYIETEYCEGRLEKGMKSLAESVSIVYEIAKGLEYAHKKNIIHGDVKISNILIKNGVYKISDWGLSKLKIDESVTLSGATPSYAAPEQISQEFGKADERTDIYQLGNVFYELLTGRLPFEGNISQIYSSILTTQPIKPSEINSNSKPVNDIIMKCLNKNKNKRYSSMGELIKELEKYKPVDKTLMFKNS
ncbi:MAG: DUF4350 domain-containing protein [Methanobacterium sp.]